MASTLGFVTFDCRDPVRVAEFWATALSLEIEGHYSVDGADSILTSAPPEGGPQMLFMPVPESKSVKNRVHLDLKPDGSMQEEVERLVAAGARALRTVLEPPEIEERWTWTVMQDPEGNEFCVGGPVDEAGPVWGG